MKPDWSATERMRAGLDRYKREFDAASPTPSGDDIRTADQFAGELVVLEEQVARYKVLSEWMARFRTQYPDQLVRPMATPKPGAPGMLATVTDAQITSEVTNYSFDTLQYYKPSGPEVTLRLRVTPAPYQMDALQKLVASGQQVSLSPADPEPIFAKADYFKKVADYGGEWKVNLPNAFKITE